MTTLEPFRRLVKLFARAFYNDEVPARDTSKSKTDKADNRGNAVVILDALARRQWMKEEELARQLHLHPKQLRRTLRALQEDRLVVREQRKENARTAKRVRQAVAAETGEEAAPEEVMEEKMKQHEYSYCALDYGQAYDVIRYRLLRAKKKLKDELEDRNTLQEYLCPSETCKQKYSALDAARLVDPITMDLHCERCDTELVEESNHLGGDGTGEGGVPGEGEDRRTRRDKIRKMLERMEKQLKPLTDQLARVKELTPPVYRTLAEWEAKASAAQRAQAMGLDVPQNAPKQATHTANAAPMPFVGETQVEVTIGGGGNAEANKNQGPAKPQKVIPAWVIREGMNLTAAQRGVKPEPEEEDVKPSGFVKTEDTSGEEEAERLRLEEYYKAYYVALQAREMGGEPEPEPGAVTVKTEVKEEIQETEEDEGVEWEEEPRTGGIPEAVANDAPVMEEEEEFEWEDGEPASQGAEGMETGDTRQETESPGKGDGTGNGARDTGLWGDDGDDDIEWEDT